MLSMLEFGLQLGAIAAALAVIYVILRAAMWHRYRFMVTIRGTELRVTKGKVHAELLREIREVCNEHGITFGWIGGVTQGKSIALRYSSNIPAGCRQRLRNVWFNT